MLRLLRSINEKLESRAGELKVARDLVADEESSKLPKTKDFWWYENTLPDRALGDK
jgi:hypothetical protein